MIRITFNTKTHTMTIQSDFIPTKEYKNVMTIIQCDGYYEVKQKQISTEKNVPILRIPVNLTLIEYIHE